MSEKPTFSVRFITDADAPNIAKRWAAQYQNRDGTWRHERGPLKATALDAIDAEIGNDSWTHITCTGCSGRVRQAVRFYDYEGSVELCADCARIIGALGNAIRK